MAQTLTSTLAFSKSVFSVVRLKVSATPGGGNAIFVSDPTLAELLDSCLPSLARQSLLTHRLDSFVFSSSGEVYILVLLAMKSEMETN